MYTQEVYDRGDAIAISWHIEDIRSILEQHEDYDPNNTLTDDECRQILAAFDKHHEGSMEAMWQDLDYHIDNFNEEKEKKDES